ncbi:decaprenylphospho-beta-D-erythro-pentofuranosid-2-ulose 2-reductase [Auraticoccus sp. F435]|uniref:Decaprenylphospho-beta-D-erythro-pentofuranosid-2-ulose 2-reductase n=1 Tax=Auraticoccus cholistanensis TaxID=2656650 RepID=A0A6A9UXQ0_9ACTN|nr:decaprenylphospho-beta-D-erythro-pentofuranosid-2-ulose 2-reductase [Auraticoccus cholistanensis]MVA76452.1 decaprenylphospho-beta-D-erythro-pentofuranosid-2-ulose 2-reductase [Auraticoccus cholistanensis]
MDALGNPRSVLLLGGTSDIALAVARRYGASGAPRPRLVLAARPGERRTGVAATLRGEGFEVGEVDFEARRPETHAATVEQAFAEGDIDVAVVAFGILGDAERAWVDAEHALELAEVNFTAPVHTGVLLGQAMSRQGHGQIIALSSVAGERVRRSNFVYGSTKAGMDGFYLGLGEALAPHGVKVLVVRPGFVRSKMTEGMDPAPLSVTPEQVAEQAVAAARAGKELIWVPGAFRWVMTVLRHVPRVLFRRLPI